MTISTYLQTLPHGVSLSVRACGDKGRPVLVFLHGFPEAAFIWDEYLEHFARDENGGYRCVAPNLRGFERSHSPKAVDQYRTKLVCQDIAALIQSEVGTDSKVGGQLACLIAHDWGGAVAWTLANAMPQLMSKLFIINSPHTGTFVRDLQQRPDQQAASAYMNFLSRPDAEQLLAENDYARLFDFFLRLGAGKDGFGWLTDAVKAQYREVWNLGLTGGCNYYRVSPVKPAAGLEGHAAQKAHETLMGVQLPREMLTINVPTHVMWGLGDVALLPTLLDGLDEYVPDLQMTKVPDATHWITHERPELVKATLEGFLNKD